MTDRTIGLRRVAAHLAGLAALGLAVSLSAAQAQPIVPHDDPFGDPAPGPARHRRPPPHAIPAPPPAFVTGYLPRNHNVPLYNEPPRRGPAW